VTGHGASGECSHARSNCVAKTNDIVSQSMR
jgi:hypothetical protein